MRREEGAATNRVTEAVAVLADIAKRLSVWPSGGGKEGGKEGGVSAGLGGAVGSKGLRL